MFKKSMAALAVLSLSAGLASASEVTLYPEFPSRFRFYTESEPLPTSLISVSCS